MSDRVAAVAIPLVALLCCLGLPLALAAGAGALVWIAGAGLPLVVLTAVGVWVVARRRALIVPAVAALRPAPLHSAADATGGAR